MILMIKWQQFELLQPTVDYSIYDKESRETIFLSPAFPSGLTQIYAFARLRTAVTSAW
jgi:hypothetical protein